MAKQFGGQQPPIEAQQHYNNIPQSLTFHGAQYHQQSAQQQQMMDPYRQPQNIPSHFQSKQIPQGETQRPPQFLPLVEGRHQQPYMVPTPGIRKLPTLPPKKPSSLFLPKRKLVMASMPGVPSRMPQLMTSPSEMQQDAQTASPTGYRHGPVRPEAYYHYHHHRRQQQQYQPHPRPCQNRRLTGQQSSSFFRTQSVVEEIFNEEEEKDFRLRQSWFSAAPLTTRYDDDDSIDVGRRRSGLSKHQSFHHVYTTTSSSEILQERRRQLPMPRWSSAHLISRPHHVTSHTPRAAHPPLIQHQTPPKHRRFSHQHYPRCPPLDHQHQPKSFQNVSGTDKARPKKTPPDSRRTKGYCPLATERPVDHPGQQTSVISPHKRRRKKRSLVSTRLSSSFDDDRANQPLASSAGSRRSRPPSFPQWSSLEEPGYQGSLQNNAGSSRKSRGIWKAREERRRKRVNGVTNSRVEEIVRRADDDVDDEDEDDDDDDDEWCWEFQLRI